MRYIIACYQATAESKTIFPLWISVFTGDTLDTASAEQLASTKTTLAWLPGLGHCCISLII